MGAKNQFRCESCGYEAMVSGGEDVGFSVSTTTISCRGCKELYDVVTAEFPPYPHQSGFEQGEPLCPQDREHAVVSWRHPGPCPRCGGQLARGEVELLWD